MTSWIELRVRRFFTCDEADVTPAVTYLVKGDIVTDDFAAGEPVKNLIKAHAAELFAGMPGTNLREMTREEVDRYLADELEGK